MVKAVYSSRRPQMRVERAGSRKGKTPLVAAGAYLALVDHTYMSARAEGQEEGKGSVEVAAVDVPGAGESAHPRYGARRI